MTDYQDFTYEHDIAIFNHSWYIWGKIDFSKTEQGSVWTMNAENIGTHKSESESNKEDKDQESIQLSTTPDPEYQWESDNVTIRHHKREPKGQPFPNRWPQGINKQACMKAKQNKTEIA